MDKDLQEILDLMDKAIDAVHPAKVYPSDVVLLEQIYTLLTFWLLDKENKDESK